MNNTQKQPEPGTWAALLAHWVAFAQAAAALPEDGDAESNNRRWKDSVASVVMLQAVVHALGETPSLEAGERAVGLDRAELLIAEHAAALRNVWNIEPMPAGMLDLLADARDALQGASAAGVLWRVGVLEAGEYWEAPCTADMVEALVAHGFAGDVFLPVKGTLLVAGSPAAFVRPAADEAFEAALNVLRLERVAGWSPPVQVYRQGGDDGKFAQDLVSPMLEELPPGRPLLMPVIEQGVHIKPMGSDEAQLSRAQAWRDQQLSAMPEGGLPLVMSDAFGAEADAE